MTSRERLQATLNHQEPDGLAVDFGATYVTGIAASMIARMREALFGDEGGYRVKVIEPYQMLGEIDDRLAEALGIDTAMLSGRTTMFGIELTDFKPFTMFDGTEVLVPGKFNTTAEPNGDILQYPEGDKSAPPSGRMPKGGFYFDAIVRQDPIDEEKLDPADNLEEFAVMSPELLGKLAGWAGELSRADKGVVLGLPGTSFGDIALVPAPWMKHPKGIRDIAEWYMSTAMRRNYVQEVFTGQLEIALANIDLLAEAVGDKADVACVTGTDFGTQRGLFISPAAYRDLYKPFHKAVNDRIHAKTNWKTFIHSCGSVVELIPDFIEAGFDILNPVQCSAEGMDPMTLKGQFGQDIVFWGGGVDTQKTLPFGTAEEVYNEVRSRIDIFGPGGGFVFGAIHNVQANVPIENVLAMFRAVADSQKT